MSDPAVPKFSFKLKTDVTKLECAEMTSENAEPVVNEENTASDTEVRRLT